MIGISFTQKTMAARKRIALVAHDHCKVFLLDWAGKKERRQTQGPTGGDAGFIQMVTLAGVLIFLILLYRRYHR